ncbi:MAG: MmgE/PrpD family protein [Alphaproteobacteria bacterium]|nr:MmgE/PrpD family protein [Alphaproteobacteria bacterium]
MPSPFPPVADQLAPVLRWLATSDPLADAAVAGKVRLMLADTLACCIAGAAKPEVAALIDGLGHLERGPVPVPGSARLLAPAAAAYAMTTAACWDEACEGLARAHGRPGLHAVPPALAVGTVLGRSLGAVLRAIVVGYEIGGRLGEVMRIRPGMHVDGGWGLYAAVGACRCLLSEGDVSAQQLETAIGIAACQMPFGLYLPVTEGKTARNTYAAHAASQGVAIALAAQAGVGAPSGALEETDRLSLMGQSRQARLAEAGTWLLLDGYVKPFAAVRHVHYGAHTALAWRARGHPTESITRLRLDIYDEAIRYCANRGPRTAIQAQFSLSYGLAHTLVHGDLGPEAYTQSALADPEVRRLEALVTIQPARHQTGPREAWLTVETASDHETFVVTRIPGDPDLPMTESQQQAKFLRYVGPRLGAEAAAALWDRILLMDPREPIAAILDAARRHPDS